MTVPPLAEGTAHVHVGRTDLGPATVDGLLRALLGPDERARAERFAFERDRLRWVAARAMMREVLAAYLDEAPERLAFQYGEHGKPALEGSDLELNLSHSGSLAVLAVARGHAVGIDVEQVRAVPDAAEIVERWFRPSERSAFGDLRGRLEATTFLRAWVRKEAVLKATGAGLGELDGVEVTAPDFPPAILAPAVATGWHLCDLEVAPDYVAALAVAGSCESVVTIPWRDLRSRE